MAEATCREEYTYQVGKITFIVTPVYKDEGEPMRDILLKLMLADLEPAYDPASQYRYSSGEKAHEQNLEWEEERRQRQEHWATVQYARRQLYDYYGTACHFNPAARGDLIRIKNMSPDEILSEASRNGLI